MDAKTASPSFRAVFTLNAGDSLSNRKTEASTQQSPSNRLPFHKIQVEQIKNKKYEQIQSLSFTTKKYLLPTFRQFGIDTAEGVPFSTPILLDSVSYLRFSLSVAKCTRFPTSSLAGSPVEGCRQCINSSPSLGSSGIWIKQNNSSARVRDFLHQLRSLSPSCWFLLISWIWICYFISSKGQLMSQWTLLTMGGLASWLSVYKLRVFASSIFWL